MFRFSFLIVFVKTVCLRSSIVRITRNCDAVVNNKQIASINNSKIAQESIFLEQQN